MDTNQLGTTVRQVEKQMEQQFKHVGKRLKSASEQVVEFVKDYPAASLAGAFAFGYIIARAARR